MLVRLSRSSVLAAAAVPRIRRLDRVHYCSTSASSSVLSHFVQTSLRAATWTIKRDSSKEDTGSKRALSSTARKHHQRSDSSNTNNTMADNDACREMEANGIPKKDEPTAAAAPKQEEQKDLPKLTPAQFRVYNRMAEHMDMFHNNFRQTWHVLHTACATSKKPQGMTLRAFLQTCADFSHHLTIHHTIEERHIFPVLAKRMPAFRKELELLSQHKQIHNGLEELDRYVEECRSGERELRFRELGEVLDGFGEVLWEHLDAEVKELRAENMRLYWSEGEMRGLPM